jgi:hypothetical protein
LRKIGRSTIPLKANPHRLAFFCLLARVCAGSCGFLRTAERAISASNRRVLLSVCTFSLRPTPPVAGRSPEGSPLTSIQINDLRADESIGFFVALVGDIASCHTLDGPSKVFINVCPTLIVKLACTWFLCDCRVQIEGVTPAWASVPLGHDMREEMVRQVFVKLDVHFVVLESALKAIGLRFQLSTERKIVTLNLRRTSKSFPCLMRRF